MLISCSKEHNSSFSLVEMLYMYLQTGTVSVFSCGLGWFMNYRLSYKQISWSLNVHLSPTDYNIWWSNTCQKRQESLKPDPLLVTPLPTWNKVHFPQGVIFVLSQQTGNKDHFCSHTALPLLQGCVFPSVLRVTTQPGHKSHCSSSPQSSLGAAKSYRNVSWCLAHTLNTLSFSSCV